MGSRWVWPAWRTFSRNRIRFFPQTLSNPRSGPVLSASSSTGAPNTFSIDTHRRTPRTAIRTAGSKGVALLYRGAKQRQIGGHSGGSHGPAGGSWQKRFEDTARGLVDDDAAARLNDKEQRRRGHFFGGVGRDETSRYFPNGEGRGTLSRRRCRTPRRRRREASSPDRAKCRADHGRLPNTHRGLSGEWAPCLATRRRHRQPTVRRVSAPLSLHP